MNNRKTLIGLSVIACCVACVGDFVVLFVFGNQYPGYSQLYDTMSSLGATASPVSFIVSAWWVILGLLFFVFAFGFRLAFSPVNKYVNLAFWLIIIYGLGEGLGSGLFKADHQDGLLTSSAIIHDILGGIGVTALVLLPLVMQKIIPRSAIPGFHLLSRFVFVIVLLLLLLFMLRFTDNGKLELLSMKGLWQRLFVFVYYVYLLIIAAIMIRNPVISEKEITKKETK